MLIQMFGVPVGVVVCRSTRAEAEEYHQYCTDTHADWDDDVLPRLERLDLREAMR